MGIRCVTRQQRQRLYRSVAAGLKGRLPWWSKAIAKILLYRLPVRDQTWHSLGLFDPGAMDDPNYAVEVLQQHLARYPHEVRHRRAAALELGPGKGLASAVTACSAGFSTVYLVDAKRLATVDVHALQRVAHRVSSVQGWQEVVITDDDDIDAILKRTGAQYLTNGLRSVREIEGESVDFIWSQAVLEHVNRSEFPDIIREFYRILKPAGVASHTIDLRDHLGNSLNNLRFPRRIWESRLLRDSGFYTNRLRRREIVGICERVGFEVEIPTVRRWPEPPMARRSLAREFRDLSADELLEAGFDLVLTKPTQPKTS